MIVKTTDSYKFDSQNSKLNPITTIDGINYYETAELEEGLIEVQNTKESLMQAVEEAKTQKIAELNKTCDALIKQFKSSATGEERIYDADIEDQLNITAIVMVGVDSYFRCSKDGINKENVSHSAEQMKQVFADGLKFKSQVIGICGVLKAFVDSQTSVDTIKSINWGWFNTDTMSIADPNEPEHPPIEDPANPANTDNQE